MINFDWALLKQQKEWLLQFDCDEANGLINMLDAIQDAAVEFGEASTEEVFDLVEGEE